MLVDDENTLPGRKCILLPIAAARSSDRDSSVIFGATALLGIRRGKRLYPRICQLRRGHLRDGPRVALQIAGTGPVETMQA